MTKAEITKAALELPKDDQLELADVLFDMAAPTPEWHRELVREAVESYQQDPDAGRSWQEVKVELWPNL